MIGTQLVIAESRRAGHSASVSEKTVARKSILFVINALNIGGAEIQVSRLADGLVHRGWSVAVASMVPGGSLCAGLRKAGVKIYSLNMKAGIPNPAALVRLGRIIRETKPDVVHSHIVHANLLARLTRVFTRMPVLICTAHNIQEAGRAHDLMYRYTDHLADLTTNVSQAAVDRYVRIKAAPANRIRFVPNGLNISHFRRDPTARLKMRREWELKDQFIWMAAGRLDQQKDYPNMIRAFAAASTGPDCGEVAQSACLLIAGEGPLEAEARGVARTLGIVDRVRFLGARSDIPAWLNIADGFVLSSAWEGMPLVLQEASACGLPIVATHVGGNAEVVLDGISGLLVPARDSTALADAMRQVMDATPAQREAMGEAGRDYVVQRYDIESILDQWEAIYQEMGSDSFSRNSTRN